MSLNRKIAHNTAIQFMGKAIGTLIAFAALTQLFRYLGPSEYGRFHIILTIVQLSGIVGDLGLYLIALNDISDPNKDPRHVANQHFILRIYLNAGYLVVMAALAFFIPYDTVIRLGIFLMSISNMFIWFGQIFVSIFQKQFKTQFGAVAEIVGRGALLIATLIMIYYKVSLVPLTLTIVIGSVVSFFISWYFARHDIKLGFTLDIPYVKDVLHRTWPVALSIWFSLLYFKADTLILSFYESDFVVGIYGMPYRILETLVTFPLMFMGLIMPLLAHSYGTKDPRGFKAYAQKGFDVLAIITAPLFFGSLFLAKPVVRLLAGEEFLLSAPILIILMISVSFIFIGSLFAHIIIAIHKQKAMIKYYIAIALLMITLYIVLIPIYSYWAAAWLTVAGEGLVFLAVFWVSYQRTRFIPNLSLLVKSVVSAIIMAAAVYFVRDWSLLFSLPFAVVVYGGALYIIGGVRKGLLAEILAIKKG